MPVLPDLQNAAFSDPTNVDNVFFPLPAGTINSYGVEVVDPETGEEESERNDHFATFETKSIAGIETVVVRDTAYEDGLLVEDTLDWYAQDDDGNVWYMGEIAANYSYDDEGEFIGTDFDGSWQTDVDGARPGWIMRADPEPGDAYFQEFYPGVAVDQGEVVATGLSVDTGYGAFDDVIKIRDTSSLEPGVGAFKYFAAGVGQVLEEEFAEDEPSLFIEIQNTRLVEKSAPVDPQDLAFAGDGDEKTITFLGEDAGSNDAIGAYAFDPVTGAIGEARILFTDTEDAKAGARVTMEVAAGQSLGLFLIPDADAIGIELEDFEQGGLFFRNFAAGDVARLYDGDDATTYTPGPASIFDGIAPVVTDDEGHLLPIRAFHAIGNRDGFNFLNPVAAENARAFADGAKGVDVVAFEDGLATLPGADDDEGGYDGDVNDAFVAVSDDPLNGKEVAALVAKIGISRLVGTDGTDRQLGTGEDDHLIGLDGDDVIRARGGDDVIEAGDGNDRAYGQAGRDRIFGEDGRDRLFGGTGRDEIEGGEGRDRIHGGGGRDDIDGDEGSDWLHGGAGFDEIEGGAGRDRLYAGEDGARLSGGADDDTLFGQRAAADVFVFDLVPFGRDRIIGFENGSDRIEIADYLEVERFGDIEVRQRGSTTLLSFAEGHVELAGVNAELIDASDFHFL